jgi:hypothetical protein
MDFVNKFGPQTKILRLFVFDRNGKFITEYQEQKESFENDFVMKLPLSPDKYSLVAYSGLDDHYADINLIPGVSTPEDLKVIVNRTADHIVDQELQPLLYGKVEVEVTGLYGQTIEVPMMKLTHTIRIIFQRINNTQSESIDINNFDFEIEANNGSYNGNNVPINDVLLDYRTYYTENGSDMGTVINTLRLIKNREYRLIIRDKLTNEVLLDANLLQLLIATKPDAYASMSDQEYLDREDEYRIVFVFDEQPITTESFLSVSVWVNDWLVKEQVVNIPETMMITND